MGGDTRRHRYVMEEVPRTDPKIIWVIGQRIAT